MPPVCWGAFDAMRFPLSYEGALPSSGNPRNKSKLPKLGEIWSIRNAIHPQIESIFENHAAFSGGYTESRALINAVRLPKIVDGNKFYPLARAEFRLKCELSIQMHVNHAIASIITNVADLVDSF
jgi:hypothetical protein